MFQIISTIFALWIENITFLLALFPALNCKFPLPQSILQYYPHVKQKAFTLPFRKSIFQLSLVDISTNLLITYRLNCNKSWGAWFHFNISCKEPYSTGAVKRNKGSGRKWNYLLVVSTSGKGKLSRNSKHFSYLFSYNSNYFGWNSDYKTLCLSST